MENWKIALIVIGAILVVADILFNIVMVMKKKALKRKAEEQKLLDEKNAKAELDAKIAEEEVAAKEFTERRSVDKSAIEQNRHIAGASAVTKKDNIIK